MRLLLPAVLLSAPLLCAAAGPIPYPVSVAPEALSAWLAAETRLNPDQVVVAGPDSVFAIEPRPGAPPVQGGRRIRLRQEVVRPAFAVLLGGRSAAIDLDVDCMGRKVMRRSAAIYTEPDLKGAAEQQGAEDRWTAAPDGTVLAAVVEGACNPLAPRPFDAARPAGETTPAPAPDAGLRPPL